MLLKFFIYSLLGCALESVWGVVKTGKLRSRRMLLGLPLCPVYGIGGVLMSHLLGGFRDNLLSLYGFGALLASIVEFAFFEAGRLMFSLKLWDYSHMPYSFRSAVCAEYTVWWGLVAVIFVSYIDPFLEKLIFFGSPYTIFTVTVFLSMVTFADIINTSKVLKAYKKGKIEKLPDCFWYMQKNS